MDTIDLTILGRRVETLIAKFEIMGQDVASLRQRFEEINAHVDLELESLKLRVDRRFSDLDEKIDLDRRANDAGFSTVLEAVARLEALR
jgi:hypothetical protein